MSDIRVLAYVLPDKPDNSTKAFFVNSNRAEQYAMMLLDSGDYHAVSIRVGQDIHFITRTPETTN